MYTDDTRDNEGGGDAKNDFGMNKKHEEYENSLRLTADMTMIKKIKLRRVEQTPRVAPTIRARLIKFGTKPETLVRIKTNYE